MTTCMASRTQVADVEVVSTAHASRFTVRLHYARELDRRPEDVTRSWEEWLELDRLLADGAEESDLIPRLPRRNAIFVTKAVLAARGEDLERWLRLLLRDPIIGKMPFLHAFMASSGRPQLKRAPSLPAKRGAQTLRLAPSTSAFDLSLPSDDRTIRVGARRPRRSPLYALDSVSEVSGALVPPSPTHTITPRRLAPAVPITERPSGKLRSYMSMQDLNQVATPAPSSPLPPTPELSPSFDTGEGRRRSVSSVSSTNTESDSSASIGSLSPITPPTTTAGRFRVDEHGALTIDDNLPTYVLCPLPKFGTPPISPAASNPFANAIAAQHRATPPSSPLPSLPSPSLPVSTFVLKITHKATGEICVMQVGGTDKRESIGLLRERVKAKLGVSMVHQLELHNGEGVISTWDDLLRAASTLAVTGSTKLQLVAV